MISNKNQQPNANKPQPAEDVLFSAAFEHVPNAIVLCDLDRKIVGFNTAAEALFGYTRQDLLGQKTSLLYADPMEFLRQGRLRFNPKANAQPVDTPYIIEYKRHDGSCFPGETRGSVLMDANNQKIGYVGVIEDVAEKQALHEIASQNNERLMALAEHAPVAVAMFDQQMCYIAASRSWRDLFQLSDDGVLGRNYYDLSPNTPNHWQQAQCNCLKGNIQRHEEDPLPSPDGQPRYLTWEMRPWYTIDGQLGGIVMYAEDVTQRRQANEIRTRQHSLLSNIIDLIPYYVFWKDRDAKYVGCNQLFAQAAGADSTEAVIGQSDFDMPWGKTGGTSYHADDMQVIETGTPKMHFEEKLYPAGGDPIVISTSKIPLMDDYGEVTGLLGIFTDVTKDRIMQDAMRAAKDAAETANQAKSEFLANMSHEIRTPMTAILGFADVLLNDEQSMNDPDTRRDALVTVRRNGEHLLSLINDILDLSKIEAGKMDMFLEPSNLPELLQQVVELIRVRAEAKRIGLVLTMAPELPQIVDTDAKRIRQVLVNLLGNAIKFTQIGQVELKAECKKIVDNTATIELTVIDSGIGMSQKQLGRLFKPFEMGDSSSSRRFGGTGLGLAISRRLARALDGDIEVLSQEGQGSRFTFRFNTCISDSNTACAFSSSTSKQPAVPTNTPNPSALEGVRILLAEDGVDNQRLIRHLLKKQGAIITVAENGRLAIERYEQNLETKEQFNLVLMDMQMPEMDGYEATRQLRRQGYQTPVVALTAHAMTGDRQACLRAGCDDYLSKPIDAGKLIQTCLHWLNRPSQHAA